MTKNGLEGWLEACQREVDFLYLYLPAPYWRIKEAERKLAKELKKEGVK